MWDYLLNTNHGRKSYPEMDCFKIKKKTSLRSSEVDAFFIAAATLNTSNQGDLKWKWPLIKQQRCPPFPELFWLVKRSYILVTSWSTDEYHTKWASDTYICTFKGTAFRILIKRFVNPSIVSYLGLMWLWLIKWVIDPYTVSYPGLKKIWGQVNLLIWIACPALDFRPLDC